MDNQPKIIEARCGNCAAWKPVEAQGIVAIGEMRRGICYGLPPTPFARLKEGRLIGQMDLRPCPPEDNSCLLFTPRADLLSDNTAPILPAV